MPNKGRRPFLAANGQIDENRNAQILIVRKIRIVIGISPSAGVPRGYSAELKLGNSHGVIVVTSASRDTRVPHLASLLPLKDGSCLI